MKMGSLIVFEGADEVGKTTLATMLGNALTSKGTRCRVVGFPGNEVGTLGHHIYELHHDSKRFRIDEINPVSLQVLHVAAHIDALDREIVPALRKGETVILDRSWWSTLVYGTAAHANKKSLDLAIQAELVHWHGILPTRVFLISRSIPFEAQVDMAKWRRVRFLYGKLALREKHKYPVTVVENESLPEAALAQIQGKLPGRF
jgi:thymidylate kinase